MIVKLKNMTQTNDDNLYIYGYCWDILNLLINLLINKYFFIIFIYSYLHHIIYFLYVC